MIKQNKFQIPQGYVYIDTRLDPNKKNHLMEISEDQYSVERCTENSGYVRAVQGIYAMKKGQHSKFCFKATNVRGYVDMFIGIAHKLPKIHENQGGCNNYREMNQYMFRLDSNYSYTNNERKNFGCVAPERSETWVLFDMDKGHLSFVVNNIDQGVAFAGE